MMRAVAVALALGLAACGGASTAPRALPVGPHAAVAARALACRVPAARIGRRYVVFAVAGNLHRQRYRSLAAARWEEVLLAAPTPTPSATPAPTPTPTASASPSASPSPTPSASASPLARASGIALEQYYGIYTLAHGHAGCAYLLTTLSGAPFPDTQPPFNAIAVAEPKLVGPAAYVPTSNKGTLTLTVARLTAQGGRGSFTLTLDSGKRYGSGRVDFYGRTRLAP